MIRLSLVAALLALAASTAHAQFSSYGQTQTFMLQPAYPLHQQAPMPDTNSLIPHWNFGGSSGAQTIQTPTATYTCRTFPTGGGYTTTSCN